MSGWKQSLWWRLVALVLCLIAGYAPQAWGQATYESLFKSMQARQAELEKVLLAPGNYLGEDLNGLLKINTNCPAEARALAEAENRDRQALYQLMGAELGLTAAQVGQERAKRNMDRYRPGVLREVRLSPSETTWWNGYPPDPRKTAVARVLALQYAKIHSRPDPSSPVVRDNVQQYEAFGVADSAQGPDGTIWYHVTEENVPQLKPPNWSPKLIGWISEKESIPWRRALVMRFTNPLNRDPSLFFRDRTSILELVQQDPNSRRSRIQSIRAQLQKGGRANPGVIAVEPQVGVRQENIIMYPVLDFYPHVGEKDLRIDGKFSRLLEVAARTRSDRKGQADRAGNIPIDIVFVMDTTESMQPYLTNTLEALKEFVSTSRNDDLRFGFIGYRDKHPAFGYQVKEFTRKTQPAVDFLHTLSGVEAQPTIVKGDDIPECVFQGINKALDSTQWRKEAIKIIFLVGDAPGRDEDNLNVRVLRDKAHTRQINIYAFHIKNSVISGGYDPLTEKQFENLSSTYEGAYGTSRQTSHFLTLEARSSDFRRTVLEHFQEAQTALEAIHTKQTKGTELPGFKPHSLTELIFQQAMLMLPDSSLPDNEVRGWVCDKVLTDPGREALAPMILLTETELEELDQRVRELKNIGEAALRGEGGTTLDFFDLVEKNTRFTMVNPSAVNFRDAFAVPLGIDQLPYESDIMASTREEFKNMDHVQDFVRSMTNKLAHYEDLKRRRGDPTVWKKLSTGARDRDRVVGVELNQLP